MILLLYPKKQRVLQNMLLGIMTVLGLCIYHQKLVDEICTTIWNDALQRLVGAIDYDINTCVSIAFDDAEKIFKSKEAQKFISDKIVNELQREIDKIGTIKIR